MTDVLLVMPPVSEAVQFPYLAMPQLTAAWSSQGYTVHCLDLNLAYRDAVLREAPEEVGESVDEQDTAPRSGAAEIFRIVSERYRRRRGELLLARSRDRSSATVQAMAIRATGRYVVKRATADGWVLRDPLPVSALEAMVHGSAGRWSAQWCLRTLRQLLDEHRPRMLAFTVPFFSQVVPTLTLATLLREAGEDVPVMMGGPTVQMWAGLLRTNVPAAQTVNYWCHGHGETYLAEVMSDAAAHPVPETTVADRGLSDGFRLNDQAAPDFQQFDFADYSNEAHQFPYRLTLGCFWGRCTFCSYGNRYHSARAFQQMDPDRAADHLVFLVRRWGIHDVAIADENTGLRHLVRIMTAVRDRGVELTFRVRARLEPELADPAYCRLLRSLGCTQISTGFETAQQELLDSVHKGQSAVEAERAVGNLRAAGIVTNLSFVDGFAHPAAAQGYEATVDAIQRNAATMGLDTMQLLVAEPGSRLWADRWSIPGDDEYLVTNEGLAFAAGRVGPPTGSPAEAEQARQRLLRMTVEAVPTAERLARPDLTGTAGSGAEDRKDHAGPTGEPERTAAKAPLRAWPRAGVALESVGGRRVLADIAWPRMAAVPHEVGRADDGALEATGDLARKWLATMLDRQLLVLQRDHGEVF